MKNKEIQDIYQELTTTYQNLKAEIFVTEILENSSVNLTDIDVFNNSTFSRSYRRDVINFKLDSYSGNTDKLQFNIARNGLYDTLPEGLFHEPVKAKSNISFTELHQKQKKQEKDARSFFSPLENEFFTQRVNIEKNERKLINEFANLKTDFLLKFWNLDPEIPSDYSIKLLQLLPYVHKISGEIELTALSLEKIIGEKVTIEKKYKTLDDNINDTSKEHQLGVDLVLELKETVISYPCWEITIGPVDQKNIDKYIVSGATKKFITIFCDYFIPMEIDTKINVTYSSKEETFVLNETNGPRMGLTTMI
ncbi:hypothetical protein D1815_07850 [Aquimarina sp. AD1]|uniref:hypothetical protein n=1 Tax=Aquimarina TaxID=290174 RepID=UPI0004285971|nr:MULTISPECIES: hypothetical protein [Aquimarina]AXT55668.1 hypothetical protein D1815_07850 [Aquimarina sp. AD1]RKN21952.1 hypothetical protein D7035_12390 [Aquimarina sp. AD1]